MRSPDAAQCHALRGRSGVQCCAPRSPLARFPSPLAGYGMHESDSLMIANQIQGLRTEVPGGLAMSFGDIRVARRADWMIERVAAMGTVVLRQLGETRAGEMRVCRFLSSPYVSVDRIVRTLGARTAAQCAGRRILAVQDTTEINFAGREKKRRGFGPAGNGKTPGFFIHPVIAVDVETEAVVGLAHGQQRRPSPGSRAALSSALADRADLPFAQGRWPRARG